MLWNLQLYNNSFEWKNVTFSGGQNILWPLLHIFKGSGPPTPGSTPPIENQKIFCRMQSLQKFRPNSLNTPKCCAVWRRLSQLSAMPAASLQPQSVTVLWPIPNYTAWLPGNRSTCVWMNCWGSTREIAAASNTTCDQSCWFQVGCPNHYTSQPHTCIVAFIRLVKTTHQSNCKCKGTRHHKCINNNWPYLVLKGPEHVSNV